MPRGDELREGPDVDLRFSDRDDEGDDLGYGGGEEGPPTTTMMKRTEAGRSPRTPATTSGTVRRMTTRTMTRKTGGSPP